MTVTHTNTTNGVCGGGRGAKGRTGWKEGSEIGAEEVEEEGHGMWKAGMSLLNTEAVKQAVDIKTSFLQSEGDC